MLTGALGNELGKVAVPDVFDPNPGTKILLAKSPGKQAAHSAVISIKFLLIVSAHYTLL